MRDQNVRKIIREELRRKVLKEVFERKIEYLVSESILNEDISDYFGSAVKYLEDNVLNASSSALKQYIITAIFAYLERQGFPIKTDSIVGSILINVIQNLTAADVKDYFSEGGCEKVSDRILKGIQEGIQEKMVIDAVLAALVGTAGGEPTLGGSAAPVGGLGAELRELINIKLLEMTKMLREPLVNFACEHRDFEKLKTDLKSMGSSSPESKGQTNKAPPASKTIETSPTTARPSLAKLRV